MKLVYLLLFNILFVFQNTNAMEHHTITHVKFEGLHRTSEDWIKTYLNLKIPSIINDFDIQYFAQKLLTTDVFSDAEVYFENSHPNSKQKILVVKVEEKWTTIPVIRGEFGGGTPLRVFGVYDTHSFGSLWTLGAEFRKYGNADPGYVFFAKAPRWRQGKHSIEFEFWRDIRFRELYLQNAESFGHINSDTHRIRFALMNPVSEDSNHWFFKYLQLGLEVELRKHKTQEFVPKDTNLFDQENLGFFIQNADQQEVQLLARSVFDNMKVFNTDIDGLRLIARSGTLFLNEQQNSLNNLEAFYFYLLQNKWNFALHGNLYDYTGLNLSSQTFLGGLDSVRGFPDGIIYGSKSFYSNFEIRHVGHRFKNLWIQKVAFYDRGLAGQTWNEAKFANISSAGIGFRLSIPQIYRLMLRVDYGWSIQGNKSHGISIGLNQFFQPYKPL